MGIFKNYMDIQSNGQSEKKVDYYGHSVDTFVWVRDEVPLTEEVGQVRKVVVDNLQTVDVHLVVVLKSDN